MEALLPRPSPWWELLGAGVKMNRIKYESMGGRDGVTTMGIKIHEQKPHTEGKLERGEILEAIRKLK